MSDSFFRLAPRPREPSQVVLVLIDDDSLQTYGRWPWSRTLLAELNTKLAQAGASVIGMDILLSEPQSPEADFALSESFRIAGHDVIVDKIGTFSDGPRWVEPLPVFARTTAVGHAQAVLDADSVCRRFPPRQLSLEGSRWAFAIEVARLAYPQQTAHFFEANGWSAGQSAAVDVAEPALLRIPFRDDDFEKISARTVLEGKAGTTLRGRPALVGFGASEIGDRLTTPLSRSLPAAGVEIHAQILDSIATRRSLRDIPPIWSAALLFICCIGSVAIFQMRRAWEELLWLFISVTGAYTAAFLIYVFAERMPAVGPLFLAFLFGPLLVHGADFIQVERSVTRQLVGLQSWLRQPGASSRLLKPDLSWKLHLLQDLQSELGSVYELHRVLLESSHDLVAIFDDSGKIFLKNQKFSDLTPSDMTDLGRDEFLRRLIPKTEADGDEVYLGTDLYLLRQAPLPPTHVLPGGGTIITLTTLRAREERDQARAEALAFVTHELRTPLTSIQGFAELMVRYPASQSWKSAPGTILLESKRLLAMINSYLNVLRLDAGSQPIVVSLIDAEKLVKGVFDVLQPLAIANRIRLTFLRHDESVFASGDRNLIQGALLNLVSNAIKYGKPGTEVLVTWSNDEAQTVIAVENQGASIPEKDLPHLFEPYFRSSAAEMTAPGWGLGLAFVRRIAEKHGGKVTVESKHDKTRFQVHLPARAVVMVADEMTA